MRLRLFGREVLPAHLSARLPAAPHAHTQMRTCIWLVMRTQKKKVLIGKEERMKTVLASVTKA